MLYLKVYEWEAHRWPEYQTIYVDGHDRQQDILETLSRRFGIDCPTLRQSYKRGASRGVAGHYRWMGFYGVISTGKRSTLATLIHEFAHHLCRSTVPKDQRTRAHGRAFKVCLRRSYAAARQDVLRPMKALLETA